MKVKELLRYYDKDLFKDLIIDIYKNEKWIQTSRQKTYRSFTEYSRYKDKEIEKYRFKKNKVGQTVLIIELKVEEE